MFRLGVYTGRHYPMDVEAADIGECCITVEDDGPVNEEILELLHANRRRHCAACRGCREAERDALQA